MTSVRVSCILCATTVEVASRDVVLHLDGSDERAANRYGFHCPSCTVYVVRPAGPTVVEALLATDVELSTGAQAPWESLSPLAVADVTRLAPTPSTDRDRDLPAITETDVRWFADLLEDDALLADWIAGDLT